MTKKPSPQTATPVFSIEAEERVEYPIVLVGKHYLVHAPKTSLTLPLIRQSRQLSKKAKGRGETAKIENPSEFIDAMLGWIPAAFSATDARDILKRLDDGDDLLDIDHISKLMEKLSEVETGNPTT